MPNRTVPNQLVETDTTTTRPEPPRRRLPWRLLTVCAAVIVALALAVQGIGALRAALDPGPTVVDHSPAPMLLALEDLAEYHAATGTFQAVVDLEQDTPYLPSVISGERTTLLAIGQVDAIVDFDDLGPEAVQASPDRRSVTIALPAPRLAPATLDPAQTRVIDRDRGVADRIEDFFVDDPVDDGELYRLAAQHVDEAAQQSDLLDRAETGTRDMLTALAGSLGYETVEVTFDVPRAPR